MNILYCGDENIEDGLVISILSLLKNVKEKLHIYVLTMDIQNENKKFKGISTSSIEYLDKIVKKSCIREFNYENIWYKCTTAEIYNSNGSCLSDMAG